MDLDKSVAQAMYDAGVRFTVSIPDVVGGQTLMLSPSGLVSYLKDREQFTLDHYGATADEFKAWLASDGLLRCGATTAAGTRCKNPISGGMQRPFGQWKALEGSYYCAVHGGEGSAEAKADRWR